MESPSTFVPKSSIRVLIIGGNVGGLSAAIALQRAGHKTFVFEARNETTPEATGGIRLPPNITKILYHWGYKERLRKVALSSFAIDTRLLTTGERLFRGVWDRKLLSDASGDFAFTHHGDFVHFLHDIADELGATVRYGVKVVEVNPREKSVRLETGEVITGDLIVGADGPNGVSRPLFDSMGEDEAFVKMYSTTIPKELILSDPIIADLYDSAQGLSVAWFGDGVSALGWPLKRPEYALVIYGPPEGKTAGWSKQGGKERMLKLLGQAEPQLRKLAESAREPRIITVNKTAPLEDWYHMDGPLALVGQAAQPIVPGSLQEAVLPFEDGVALGRIFSYLKRHEEIPAFLAAYEDVRREWVIRAYNKQLRDVQYMTLPDMYTKLHDTMLRKKGKSGCNLFDVNVPTDTRVSDRWEEWKKLVDEFIYNAEEAADDWWHAQGKFMEASRGGVIDGPVLQIMVEQNTEVVRG